MDISNIFSKLLAAFSETDLQVLFVSVAIMGLVNTLFVMPLVIYLVTCLHHYNKMIDTFNECIRLHEDRIVKQYARINVMFESLSQRIEVLNHRLKEHFRYFGIKEPESVKRPNHYVKNNVKNKKNHKYEESRRFN
jgi:hypothetical protein